MFYFHVGFDRIADINTANGAVTSYIYEPGIDRPLAMIDPAGNIMYFHQDVLGNVVALTSHTGTLVQQYRYTVWGEPQVFNASNQSRPISEARSPFLFTAREFDLETGLYHYRARAYSPQLGWFLQFDPIDFGGGDLCQVRYRHNSVLRYRDPFGTQSCSSKDDIGKMRVDDIYVEMNYIGETQERKQLTKLVRRTSPKGAAMLSEAGTVGVLQLFTTTGAGFNLHLKLFFSCCRCDDGKGFYWEAQKPLSSQVTGESGLMGDYYINYPDVGEAIDMDVQFDKKALESSAKSKCKE